jgi:hypothetical protein
MKSVVRSAKHVRYVLGSLSAVMFSTASSLTAVSKPVDCSARTREGQTAGR